MGHRWVLQNIASTSIEPYFAGRPASNEDWDLASVLDRSRGGRTPPNSFPHIYFFFTFPFVLVVGGRWWGAPPVGTKAPPNTAASSYPSVELVVAHQNKRGHVGGGHVPLEDLSGRTTLSLTARGSKDRMPFPWNSAMTAP